MKKCTKCGAIQNDNRHHCVDCGEKLGKPLSKSEALEIEEQLDNALDDMSDRTEDFYVPLRDKIMAVISVLGIIAAIILLILCGQSKQSNRSIYSRWSHSRSWSWLYNYHFGRRG